MKKMLLIGGIAAILTACDNKSDVTIVAPQQRTNPDAMAVQTAIVNSGFVAAGRGEVVLKVPATDELNAIAAKEKTAKFWGGGVGPSDYDLRTIVQEGYCLIDITQYDYRILCGVPENYDDPYAVALMKK